MKDPTQLAETLRLSKVIDSSGRGVLIFVEDIDQVTRGNRDAAMQDILNTLDGGDTKDMNVISLFTTNHLELIEPTFLRGKRIGTVISMGFLDEKTALRFMQESFSVGGFTLSGDMTEVCARIKEAEIAPAFMAEIVEAVKTRLIFDERTEVYAKDIMFAVDSYVYQMQLARKKPTAESPAQLLASNLASCVTSEWLPRIEKRLEKMEDLLRD